LLAWLIRAIGDDLNALFLIGEILGAMVLIFDDKRVGVLGCFITNHKYGRWTFFGSLYPHDIVG
jgi:hypothetical protein